MSRFSSTVKDLVLVRREAANQGGLLTGEDPSEFNTSDPLRLWIIQVGVIILMTQLLGLGLRRIRQPRVIAEVLGGILLGPTAFGRIPGFTEHVFPQPSRPYLALIADIGLCLFLFLVGLEIDGSVVKRNFKLSATVGLAGMALPFGLGAALSIPLYKQFIDHDVAFTNFMLFTGVAYSITAFPVLCRILVELQLLDTTVGVVVLSAGVANDVVGWILLALAIGLVNGGGGLQALYILLVTLAFTIFLLSACRWAIHWLARKTGSIEHGPTVFFMTVVILTVFGSAFFTDIIGVNAIFGAFLAGLIVPRDNHLALSIAEKLEDMASVIFLPLYFTLSGLSTNLGLLDNGITWGFTIAIMVLAYVGKMGGCTLAARSAGFTWRESSTIGSLMSCKGLIELIVLNVGLSAGILSQRVFSMFVLEALVLTFMTTPAVSFLYPAKYRVRAVAAGQNFASVAGDHENKRSKDGDRSSTNSLRKSRFTVVLDRPEHLPGMMAITQILQPSTTTLVDTKSDAAVPKEPISVEALRLIELSGSVFSGVMKSSHAESLLQTDPLLSIFQTFGQLHGINVSTALSVVSLEDQSANVIDHIKTFSSDMVLLPWLPSWATTTSERDVGDTTLLASSSNAFGNFFNPSHGLVPSNEHAHFVRGVFSRAPCAVGLFVDRVRMRGQQGASGRSHLVLPFFGGPDDRLALDFLVQMCAESSNNATVIRISRREASELGLGVTKPQQAHVADDQPHLTVHSAHFPDTVYGPISTEHQLQSATADDLAWARYTAPDSIEALSLEVQDAIKHITFTNLATPQPLHAAVEYVTEMLSPADSRSKSRVYVVCGRARRLATDNTGPELQAIVQEHGAAAAASEVRKTIGDMATAFVAARTQVGLLVLQAPVVQE